MFLGYYPSKIAGLIEILTSANQVIALNFVHSKKKNLPKIIPDILKSCIKQLDEYFLGKRQTFNLDLYLDGTEFQKKVWEQLMKIPYGSTCAYQDIARKIRHAQASRAVGTANGCNHIPIIIPCHRVIASNGGLGGYTPGLSIKRNLLMHEEKFK